jgi:hypothetical protein
MFWGSNKSETATSHLAAAFFLKNQFNANTPLDLRQTN